MLHVRPLCEDILPFEDIKVDIFHLKNLSQKFLSNGSRLEEVQKFHVGMKAIQLNSVEFAWA